jgi:hypothetical protein
MHYTVHLRFEKAGSVPLLAAHSADGVNSSQHDPVVGKQAVDPGERYRDRRGCDQQTTKPCNRASPAEGGERE